MCVCVAFFALTLCYILLSFLSILHGVYTRDCSCIYMTITSHHHMYIHTYVFICGRHIQVCISYNTPFGAVARIYARCPRVHSARGHRAYIHVGAIAPEGVL